MFTPGRVIDDVELRDRTALDAPRAGPATGGLLHAVRGRATRTIETRMLQDALERHHGNVTAMAREMGITRRAIHQKLKRYALPAAPYRCDGRATRR
ncbi:helix-turn-helix domain-containing protein [Acidiferrobacter sp.]|uniref:helix-turn-helix domain-containing protein n=1 Tax=Acidiferrobacter sp. TaxID=1872107 RepID=UPI00263125DF|nr:helix-turn-helix domain-containing protein [Acidiferrobacter sp.]